MKPCSVLVLDDDDDLREEIRDAIASAGHEVLAAGDASILDSPRFQTVDVLVLDLSLPKVDGIDVLKRIAAMPDAPQVIVISGHGESILRTVGVAAESEGVRLLGMFAKPLDPDRLIELIGSQAAVLAHGAETDTTALVPALVAAIGNGTLVVDFQPKVATRTLSFAGAEALLGNHLPGFGRVSPPAIVEAARSVPGLLVRLTHEVLRLAAAGCATWTRAGWTGMLNVNVPIEALLTPDAVPAIVRIVNEAGIEPRQVTLELVEDSLYDSSSAALGVIAKLRLAGFGLALDDVGRRQSGLVQLANLAVTEIKIDLELIHQARTWEKARSIFVSLAELGERLGIPIVAEGVELPEDLDLVRRHPVSYIQGYLISPKRPLLEMIAALPRLHEGLLRLDLAS